MLLFAEERLPAIPSGDHEDEDDDGVDDNHEDEDDDGVDDYHEDEDYDGVDGDQYGDGDLHSHLITSDDRSFRNLTSVSTLPNELEDAVFLLSEHPSLDQGTSFRMRSGTSIDPFSGIPSYFTKRTKEMFFFTFLQVVLHL